jgi:hypothetical protein
MSLIKILASEKNITLYRKELNQITGSPTATILFSQLLYWFDKVNYAEFYKFLSPVIYSSKIQEKDKKYKEGDSWTEELGFSEYEFTNAFSKIGKRYKSRTEYQNANDVNDYMFYSYIDKISHLTYYGINKELIEESIKIAYESKKQPKLRNLISGDQETQSRETKKLDFDITNTENTTEITAGYNKKNKILPQKSCSSKRINKEKNFTGNQNNQFQTDANYNQLISLLVNTFQYPATAYDSYTPNQQNQIKSILANPLFTAEQSDDENNLNSFFTLLVTFIYYLTTGLANGWGTDNISSDAFFTNNLLLNKVMSIVLYLYKKDLSKDQLYELLQYIENPNNKMQARTNYKPLDFLLDKRYMTNAYDDYSLQLLDIQLFGN